MKFLTINQIKVGDIWIERNRSFYQHVVTKVDLEKNEVVLGKLGCELLICHDKKYEKDEPLGYITLDPVKLQLLCRRHRPNWFTRFIYWMFGFEHV